MTSLKIIDIKGFMSKCLTGDVFDCFLMAEATITTYNTFHIDGHIHKEFYSDDDVHTALSNMTHMSYWKNMKSICYELIKGKTTPLGFQFILQLNEENTLKFLSQISNSLSPDDVNGLILNIKYNGTILSCITATSLSTFTLDKTLENSWDSMVKKFLTQSEIEFDELV